jgi:hypothetical protein
VFGCDLLHDGVGDTSVLPGTVGCVQKNCDLDIALGMKPAGPLETETFGRSRLPPMARVIRHLLLG